VKVALGGIEKRYGSVRACDGVDFEVESGEVVALLGENGAGKSTLMKVLYGFERPDAGTVTVDGRPVAFKSPRDAQAHGIGMVFQEFSLVPALTALENVFLGASVPWWLGAARAERLRALSLLDELCPGLDANERVATLSVAEKQLVELAKLLFRGAKLLILDEPSAVLAEPEAARLWARIAELKAKGHGIVLVTHKVKDVAAVADRMVAMRSGRVVARTRELADHDAIVTAMVGTPVEAPERRLHASGASLLRVQGVSVREGTQELAELSFEVFAGEVLGIAGVAGNGQELFDRLLAALVRPTCGSIDLETQPLRGPNDPRIGYVPEHARAHGVAGSLSAAANLLALEVRSAPFWNREGATRSHALASLERFDVRPCDPDRAAHGFSGGNLQKLVVARELGQSRRLVVACFPTMGLDVHASARVVRELVAKAEEGAAVVWISEDLDALLGHADRVAVLYRGRLRGPRPVNAVSRAELGAWMTGAAA